MALILNIDTATPQASVCLSRDGRLLAMESNPNQKDHAAFLQPAIQRIMASVGVSLSAIDAVAVSNGPGSYTGLRVGLSSAKGICYALGKPLLLLNTLQVMAAAAMEQYSPDEKAFFCPMIDARRMEIFTAVFDRQWNTVLEPTAMIVEEQSFAELLAQQPLVFSGDGSKKCVALIRHDNARFVEAQQNATHMQAFSEQLYERKSFADLAYSEPFYLKEFFTTAPKLKSD